LQRQTNSKSNMIYQTAQYSTTLNDPYLDFKVTPSHDAEYFRNGTRYRHTFNEMDFHMPYSTVSFRMTLSDLAKIQWHAGSRGLSATAELLVIMRQHTDAPYWYTPVAILSITFRHCSTYCHSFFTARQHILVSGIEHSASPVQRRGTVCRQTFVLHQHSVLSKICSRLICFFIHFHYQPNFEKRMLYGALVVTLWTCYGAL